MANITNNSLPTAIQPSSPMTVYSSPSYSTRKPPIVLPGQHSNRVRQTAALFERVASKVSAGTVSSSPPSAPNRLPDDRREKFNRRHSSQPSSQLSSPLLSFTPERLSEYPSQLIHTTNPDPHHSPAFLKPDPEFRQMLSFEPRPELSSFNDRPHTPESSQEIQRKHRSVLDMPYSIPSLVDDTLTIPLPQPPEQAKPTPPEEPRSDSDSTTTSNMQRSSVGTFSANGSDPPPLTDPDPRPTTEDLFLEQEPLSSLEPTLDPSPTLFDQPQPSSPKDEHAPLQIYQAEATKPEPEPNLEPASCLPPDPAPSSLLDSISVLGASARLTEVGMMIQEVALALFEVQELRHSNAFNSDSIRGKTRNALDASPSVLASAKTLAPAHLANSAGASALTPVDRALMKLDKKVEETTVELSQLASLLEPYDSSQPGPELAFLHQKHAGLLAEWAKIQKDTELLRDELKEDKWLVVFRTVSGQAEEMMGSLEKALAGAQEFIFELTRQRRRQSDQSRRVSGRLKKSSNESQLSVLHETSPLVMDPEAVQELLDRYLVLCKNFVAKKKHYLPSCERVLTTLVKGIENRSTKNGEVLRRYADMRTRFNTIQQRIARTDAELAKAEDILRQTIELDGQPVIEDKPKLVTVAPVTAPETPQSASSHRTSRAFTAVSQYLSPSSSSPVFLSKRSSSLKKLASKITPAKHQPSSPITSSTQGTSVLSRTAESVPAPPRQLRQARSIFHLPSHPPRTHARRTSASPACFEAHVTPPTLMRAHSSSQQQYHLRSAPAKAAEKPRWNISLKRTEDQPAPRPVSRAHGPPPTRGTTSRCPSRATHLPHTAATHQHSQHTPGGWPRNASMPPELISGGYAQVYPYIRPGSATGRSDCSGVTTHSVTYRPRPPSRVTRIPAPVVNIYEPQRTPSRKTPSRAGAATPAFSSSRLPRPSSRCGTPGPRSITQPPNLTPSSTGGSGLAQFSPTPSDLAKLPTIGSTYDFNPYDPLDKSIWLIVKSQMVEISLQRIDPPLSRNPEKVKQSGGGIGDQARYKFGFGINEHKIESKPLMCKLILKHSIGQSSKEKVLVRFGGGWRELEMYLLDEIDRYLNKN
ncbi:hypothetical protein CROQUDRAFT_665725 [Cronartium quercuum f. sp. fusiforme G11]|uniref:GAR domain-containing protein n=1 Tax=Cronartium quercuum f. sp. fusiforme G11 TaxID=708437 RepID=A0A9P6T5S3_9BASI|nr:hypothetical protein CROQUDRAFT_665725 [Cronartium quercuum f. sp. fusiforme G11]